MLQLTIELPEPLSQEVEASGMSYQQLGRVMTYLLEMYLKIEQSQKFIQVAATNQGEQEVHQGSAVQFSPLDHNVATDMTDNATNIVDKLAGSLGPAAPDELDYFNTADLSWQRFAE